jgi:diguanylate cyclase (GGDEF)-like protein/PAS domain S-box-containing protein
MKAATPMATTRILVIDDNEAIHEDFRKILRTDASRAAPTAAEEALFGKRSSPGDGVEIRVDSALQGAAGIARVRDALREGRPYAVAFVDMRMPPGWDGVETTLLLWEADPDIQVVICTAYSDYSWGEMLSKLGKSDRLVILKKPFDPIEVQQLASALAEKWRLGREVRATVDDLERRVTERTLELAHAGDRLRQSEAQYRLLFDGNPNPMWVYDTDTLRFVLVNAAAVARYGYSRDEFLRMTIDDIRPAEDIARSPGGAAEGPGPRFSQMRHCTRDRSMLEVEISSDQALFDGREARLVLAHDVTQRKRSEDGVKRLNRVYAVLSGINTLIVRATDRDELFREACEIAVEHGLFRVAWIGILDKETAGLKPIASAGDVDGFFDSEWLARLSVSHGGAGICGSALRQMKAVVSNDVRNDPLVFSKATLEARAIQSVAIIPLVVGGAAVGVLALYSEEAGFFDAEEMRLLQELAGDISFAVDHIGKQDLLEYLAGHDVLTGLANRTQFLGRLAQWVRSAAGAQENLALYVLDLERFKNINDTLGQTSGDALLRQVAAWFSRAAGDASFVARVGSDQFAVVVTGMKHAQDAARVIEKTLREFMEHPFQLQGSTLRVAAKAGVALFPDDALDADVLFRNAEAALKKAKEKGDRYLFYAQKMTDMVAGRLALENQMRQALDRGEFILHYQPKVSAATGALTGAEALIRWKDPRTGKLVPPIQFIPILEETGLIYDVGRWALRQALADFVQWRDTSSRAVRIAVNVSPLQLRNLDFVAEIARVIGVDAAAAAGLELEITESVIMDDPELSIATLKAIRLMGVPVAIDDFGTGYSSLSYLAKLPVDTLKIDRAFVTDITTPDGLALVTTIVHLAHSMKLKVVAEGVETEVQAGLLRSLACDELQGYLFSKPVPAAEFFARFLAATPELEPVP